MKLNKFDAYAKIISSTSLISFDPFQLSQQPFHSLCSASGSCFVSWFSEPHETQNLSYLSLTKRYIICSNVCMCVCVAEKIPIFLTHALNITHHHAHDIWWNKSNFRHIFVISSLPFCYCCHSLSISLSSDVSSNIFISWARHSWCLVLWINKCLLRDITWFISYLLFALFFSLVAIVVAHFVDILFFLLCVCTGRVGFSFDKCESIRSACGTDIDKAMCYCFFDEFVSSSTQFQDNLTRKRTRWRKSVYVSVCLFVGGNGNKCWFLYLNQ